MSGDGAGNGEVSGDGQPLIPMQSLNVRDMHRMTSLGDSIKSKPDADESEVQAAGGVTTATHDLPLSPVQQQYLKPRLTAREVILRKLKKEGFDCSLDLERGTVSITGTREHKFALRLIEQSLVEIDLPAEPADQMPDAVAALPTAECDDLGALYVKMQGTIKVIGMADGMDELTASLRASQTKLESLPTEDVQEYNLPLNTNYLKYLLQYKWPMLEDRIKAYPEVTVTPGQSAIAVSGPSSPAQEVVDIIQKQVNEIKSYIITLRPGINVAHVGKAAINVEKMHGCLITMPMNLTEPSNVAAFRPGSHSISISGRKEVKVKVVVNALEKQEADVIVNSTTNTLKLGQTKGVSRCLLQAAGPTIQAQLKASYPKGIKYGEVAESTAGNIQTCQTIYHGALPGFPQYKFSKKYVKEQDECFKWLVSLVFNCLIKASEKGYKTIAFPAFGTGQLQYPVQHVVQLVYKAIRLYNDDKRSGPIQQIYIVIHPETKLQVKQLFLAHQHTHAMETLHVTRLTQLHEELRKDKPRRCEARTVIGNCLLQVIHGSTKVACDVTEAVLVMWTDEEILKPEINPALRCIDPDQSGWNCSSYVSELSYNKVAVDSTTLSARTLIHTYCKDKRMKTLSDAIVQGLTSAGSANCHTIAIPIHSKGYFAENPTSSAEVIFNAVKQANVDIFVVTVAISDNAVFSQFVTKMSGMCSFQTPADVDKSPVAVDLWKKTYADKASESHASFRSMLTLTKQDTMLLFVSDSDETNKKAALEFEKDLKQREHHTSHAISLSNS